MTVDSTVVGEDLEVGDTRLGECPDQDVGDTAQTEPADRQGLTVGDVRDGFGRGPEYFRCQCTPLGSVDPGLLGRGTFIG